MREAMTRGRAIAAAAICALGFVVALWRLGGHYPPRDWLIARFAPIWIATLVWAAACLAAGDLALRLLLRRRLATGEHLVLASALGVLVFSLGIFLVGIAGGLGPVAFVLVPLALLAAGVRGLARWLRRTLRLLAAARRRPRPPPSPWRLPVLLFGAAGIGALYFNILTPGNAAYDAHWYHLGLAEHYAVAGAVTRFPEGWFPGAVPQLASTLYTWAFLAPGADLWTHIELAAHVEFAVFLATLAALPVLVRRLVGGARVPLAWAALFLFPGIFVYDSAPSLAADHVAAFFAIPIALATARFLREATARHATLLGAVAAGAFMTKYQAAYLLAGPALAVLARTALGLARPSRLLAAGAWSGAVRAALAPPLVGLAAFALLTAPHWLKNALWYGDPLYPLLHHLFDATPWNPNADPVVTMRPPGWQPTGTLGDRLGQTAAALATFAFKPHDWPAFHRDWPVFGFLFTLLLPATLLAPRAHGGRALRALAGATLVGLVVWYSTQHQDRYLQILVPWMAAVVAAVIRLVWHMGKGARAALALLVGLQVLWSADHTFLPTHAMIGHPARASMDLVAAGFQGRRDERFDPRAELAPVARALPPGAVVLLHEQHLRLGIGARVVSDARGTQGAISYGLMRSPREVWDRLRALGVTHLVWPAIPLGLERWADEIVFHDFVSKHTRAASTIGSNVLGELGPKPPEGNPFSAALVIGCRGLHRVPVAELDAAVGAPGEAVTPERIAAGLDRASFAVVEASCRPGVVEQALGGWRRAGGRAGHEIWVRP